MYRERVAYHESVEEELKRNLESQVDVVLRMEEERLMLLKEGKEVKERENKVRDENKRMRERIEQVETELEGLQVQIKEQMSMMQQSDSVTTEDEKENKNVMNRVKPAPSKNTSTIKKPVKKATSTLKFQPALSKAGPLADTSAISTT
jgi:beta-glucosidase-like glycosyl hydrolase